MAKICCGGFELGEGLVMDGRTLNATGGSGGGGMFVINVTEDDDGNYIADKTYTEIKSAYDSGMMPIVFENDDSKIATYLQSVDDENGVFVFARCDAGIGLNEKIQGFAAFEFHIRDDDTITFRYGGVAFAN